LDGSRQYHTMSLPQVEHPYKYALKQAQAGRSSRP
jgi:hypothetical protein